MNFLFLGYLYLYIAINPAKSSDSHISIETTEEQYEIQNCTQCSYNYRAESLCTCMYDIDKCLVCCTDSCCTCDDCTPCRDDRQLQITVTQVIVSILLGFGIIGLIIIYCKLCYRTSRIAHRRFMLQQGHNTRMHCNTIDGLQERPPPYSEMIRGVPSVYMSSYDNAPPLYTSPYNRISMQESPPSYPGTPKPQERPRDSNESSCPSSVAQYI